MDNTIQAHQKELCNKLWAMANALRGNMEAYEFKNYILGMIFYYYLSDKTEKYMVNLLNLSLSLKSLIPDGILFVSESGIQNAVDIKRLHDAGADAVLIGEALMSAPDKKAKLAELRSLL